MQIEIHFPKHESIAFRELLSQRTSVEALCRLLAFARRLSLRAYLA
jgi:hypothetical protein